MESYQIGAFAEIKAIERELKQNKDPKIILERYEKRLEQLEEETKVVSMTIDVLKAYIEDKSILAE